ncbi:S-layer homology domain-containing protein [Paenibacillus qinlingensis]|uniref:Pectate disaccharide-lyase n=1 Tax=Paenibacillus qinlingensis TaxID=1837343 RepID=A0ABU1P7A4_9BACL|nr:S-layer homology domain-containing protein [Paenibacillus qinlingensis]MDR6555643.1 hypothetical protein [Paenibacillus qinlingensis]
MNQQKRLFAAVMSLVLLFSMIPFSGSAAALGAWTGSTFGGSTGAAPKNSITSNTDGSVTLKAVNGGKIASTDEGLSFYYKQISLPADANFELRARAKVVSFTNPANTPNQASFGLMVRGNIGSSSTATSSNYVAVGGFGVAAVPATGTPASTVTQVVYKTGATEFGSGKGTQFKLNTFSHVNEPIEGEEYELSIKKSGNAYQLTINGQSQTLFLDLFSHSVYGNKAYAGFYVARDAEVIFSDYNISVDSQAPTNIQIDKTAMKTTYLKDQSFDATGLKVTSVTGNVYEELSNNDYVITGFDSSKVGINTITVNYNGAIKTIDLMISPLTVTAFDMTSPPSKTVYYTSDLFDPEGLVVTAGYDSGHRADLTRDKYTVSISNATVTGSTYTFDTPGIKTVTIQSTETPARKTTFNVTVKNALLTGLEIAQPPQKTIYYLGDTFKPNGMAIYAKYNDNSRVRLMNNEYIAVLDTNTAGSKQVAILYRGQQASTSVTVKQKALTGIKVNKYPKTTYLVGEDLVTTGLSIVKVFDNLDTESLTSFTTDASNYDKNTVGIYDIRIIPTDTAILPITYKVAVRAPVEPEWKTIRFGQSTTAANNTITPHVSPNVHNLVALEGGGKITGDHDGISFYYTELDAVQDNFELSADVKVTLFAKNPYDGQESFGIMARDAIGTPGDSSVFASNIAAIGGYSGGTTKPIGTQLFVRTGVEDKDGKGSKGIQSTMLNNVRPAVANANPPSVPYKLTLSKTNSGFSGSLNSGTEAQYFVPDIMNIQDSKMYVGFYTARLATIDVSNVKLKITAAEADAPKVEGPQTAVTPDLQVLSLDQTSKTAYDLTIKPTVNGTVTIKKGEEVLALDTIVEAGKAITFQTSVAENATTNFNATFLPDDTQLLTSYSRLVQTFSVTMKTFGQGEDIYVSPTGTSAGTGSVSSPLDLDTAIAYVSAGQTIIVQDGRYVRSSKLDIKKGNNGTANAKKSLIAALGAQPVIDFVKKSEGVVLSGNYWHVKGIDVKRSAANTKGFTVGGNYNIVENSRFYSNGDTGLQISSTDGSTDKAQWPSYNLILNCESFDNIDPANNNADGFAAKLTSGEGNVFRGDIAHNNIDDGWDLYTKVGSGAIGAVTIEDSIAYNNGKLTTGLVGAGDKNGFKLGGEGIHVPHIIRNSMAFGNGANGFTSNSNPGVIVENNVGFNNAGGNLDLRGSQGIVDTDFTLSSFVSYQKNSSKKDNYPSVLVSDNNYLFNGTVSANKSGVKLSDANFESLTELPYQRDTDGNIIWGAFLQFISPLSAPTSLSAIASDAKAILSWNTVTGAAYYNVSRGMTEHDSYTQIATNVTSATYTNSGLINGTTYYFKVTAANALGEGQYSNSVRVVPDTTSDHSTGGSSPAAPTSNEDSVHLSVEPVNQTINGKTVAVATVDGSALSKAFDALVTKEAKEQKIFIEVNGSENAVKVQLDANVLATGLEKAPNTIISITNNGVSYHLPVKSLDLVDIAKMLGAEVNQVKMNISLEKVTGEAADLINAKAKEAGLSLVSDVFDFMITAEGNGKTVTVNDFGHTYVSRTITLVQAGDTNQLTAVMYDPETGGMTFVPAIFDTSHGKTTVTIKRPGNSLYAIVQSSKTFDDVKAHWAKADVELLASKLVIKGVSDSQFVPNASITRAEFAALLTRALGLNEDAATAIAKFNDVTAGSWYAGSIGAAVKADLINGFEDGSFLPNERITREQMAVMMTRAMTFAGTIVDVDLEALAVFADAAQVSGWAKDAVSQAMHAGIVRGVTESTFHPKADATRAEAAVMLKRFLQVVHFINE